MYQVLARKYRPRNFNELVGQNHVSRALTSALERGRLHHAYLFTGTRGVGKTTIARILAKCLNCETGVTSTPCEVCATCKAVNEGRFIDLIEIDAASRTKVEDTRELLDNVPYAPTQGRFKVYLIDEVHMLSTHSFNALLKTLEEPPEHVKFLFATTDPQKLPITVNSRCLQFTLRPLDASEIKQHLTEILLKEHINNESDAIWQIAESAQGSLRDALSLTDQAIAYGQGQIHQQDVKDMLGLIDRTIIYDLILAIHQNQAQKVSQLLLQFRQQALDVALVLDQLISTLHELALMQYLPDLSLKYSQEINHKIRMLSQNIAAVDLQLYYQIACKGRSELSWSVTQEQGFEMCVLRLLAFRPLQANEVVVQQPTEQLAVEHHLDAPTQTKTAETEVLNTKDEQDTFVESTPSPSKNFEANNDAVFVNAEPVDETSEQQSAQVPFEQNVESDLIHFDAEQDDALIEVSVASHSEQAVIEPHPQDDVFAFDYSTDADVAQNATVEVSAQVPETPVQPEQVESFGLAEAALPEPELQAHSSQTPQQILQVAAQELSGDWTVEKWEFWFRNSQLSPAVQELAQYGVMQGEINAESTFHIPEEYQQLLTQQQHNLEHALKQQWQNTRFAVQYGEVSMITPFVLQQQRKQNAHLRAEQLIHADETVAALIESFNGEIRNIQLKTD